MEPGEDSKSADICRNEDGMIWGSKLSLEVWLNLATLPAPAALATAAAPALSPRGVEGAERLWPAARGDADAAAGAQRRPALGAKCSRRAPLSRSTKAMLEASAPGRANTAAAAGGAPWGPLAESGVTGDGRPRLGVDCADALRRGGEELWWWAPCFGCPPLCRRQWAPPAPRRPPALGVVGAERLRPGVEEADG
mmetsp:Transcript_7619/g.21333  ORF Transcript_7619/g.21333 Transcript_7619/m.21333 type:complete len:195 (-) Transcript_7619:1449-2033(-)